MKNVPTAKVLILSAAASLLTCTAHASEPDSLARKPRFQHAVGAEFRPGYIVPTNPFLAGEYPKDGTPMSTSYAAHLRYSFRFRPGSQADWFYGGVYQGIGAAYYAMGNPRELGNPKTVYLFQGGRIARIAPRLTLNYEWNLGLSFGWVPYHPTENKYNVMMGSRINAYLNTNFYFNWTLARHLELSAGLSLTHFSNGNTTIPNAGLNSVDAKVGLTYLFARAGDDAGRQYTPPPFRRHMSYDVVLFGSWRKKGVELRGKMYASPDAYPVAGFSFAPMYNFSHKFRAGLALDAVYDGSANVWTEDYIFDMGGTDPGYTFYKPSIDMQLALGLSARAEFVMPYFTIGIGMGWNVLHKGGDLRSFYQMLTLKIAVTRNAFLHVGYNLKDFHMPNYLMLGVGYRFNNKSPIKQ